MKKILFFMLLFLIFIANVVNAEKYQISCDLILNDPNVFCGIWNYLDSKRGLGFSDDIQDSGDMLFPSEKILVPIEESYRLKLRLRMDSQDERDAIWYYLLSQKPFVASKVPGRIEKHICRHDEEKVCTQQENESWCQEVEF